MPLYQNQRGDITVASPIRSGMSRQRGATTGRRTLAAPRVALRRQFMRPSMMMASSYGGGGVDNLGVSEMAAQEASYAATVGGSEGKTRQGPEAPTLSPNEVEVGIRGFMGMHSPASAKQAYDLSKYASVIGPTKMAVYSTIAPNLMVPGMISGARAIADYQNMVDRMGYSTTVSRQGYGKFGPTNPNVVDPNRPMNLTAIDKVAGMFGYQTMADYLQGDIDQGIKGGEPASDRGGTAGDVDKGFGMMGADEDVSNVGPQSGDYGRTGYVDDPSMFGPGVPGPYDKENYDYGRKGSFHDAPEADDPSFDFSPSTPAGPHAVTDPEDPSWDFHFADTGPGARDPGGISLGDMGDPPGPGEGEAGTGTDSGQTSGPGSGGGDDGSGLGHGGGGGLGGGEGGEGDVGSGDAGDGSDGNEGYGGGEGGARGDGTDSDSDSEGFW